ncbi:ABC transporter permease [Streptomyces sp. L7]
MNSSRFSLKHPRSRIGWIRPAVWLPLVVMLGILAGLWQWGSDQLPYLLPPLSDVGSSLSGNFGYYVHNALITLGEATAGLGMGFVGAFVLAVLTSELPLVRRAVMPVAVVLNASRRWWRSPRPWSWPLGVRADAQTHHHRAEICFFPILINTATGLRSVPQQVLQVSSDDGCESGRAVVRACAGAQRAAVPLRRAADRLFRCRIIGAVVAEMSASGSTGGLGTAISVPPR